MRKITGAIGTKMVTLLAIFFIICVVFAVWAELVGDRFLRISTFVTIGDMLVLTSFLAIGSGFLMVSGNLDLSASSIGAFSSIMMAACLRYFELSTGAAIILAILCSTAFGILNAVLVYEFNFAPFIATLAMASVVQGVMQFVSVSPATGHPMNVVYSSDITRWIGRGQIAGIPAMLIFALIVFIIYGLILAKTKFGKQVYIVGSNKQAAELAGISPRKIYYILFANSAFLASIAGVIHMGRQSQGDLTGLANNQFTGITAAILGGVSFGGGSGNMAGVFVGLMLLNTFTLGTVIVRLSFHWSLVMQGGVLLAALVLDYFNEKRVLARHSVVDKSVETVEEDRNHEKA